MVTLDPHFEFSLFLDSRPGWLGLIWQCFLVILLVRLRSAWVALTSLTKLLWLPYPMLYRLWVSCLLNNSVAAQVILNRVDGYAGKELIWLNSGLCCVKPLWNSMTSVRSEPIASVRIGTKAARQSRQVKYRKLTVIVKTSKFKGTGVAHGSFWPMNFGWESSDYLPCF